jgi:phospholipid/cholesterol/gamma-HCH transport system permease protein
MDTQGRITFDSYERGLICSGEWTFKNLTPLKTMLTKIAPPEQGNLIINGQAVTHMDTAGAWLLNDYVKKNSSSKLKIQLQHFSEQAQILLDLVQKYSALSSTSSVIGRPSRIARLGRVTVSQWIEFKDFLKFTGELVFEFIHGIAHPVHWRWRELTAVISTTGLRALPIIALLSFMIGVVISYQMGNQLRNYGANIFIVNLLGLSILREFGPLITAIMVAGRTGSAFTAQLGTMKLNQEVDALNTMGITPAKLLLLPRVLGLFITLPLLTMWANLFGVMGGILMANDMLGITPYDFLQRFQHEIPVRALWIGLGKAPVFALLISSIGCFQGMKVQGSADSVGKQTTRSVVLAIFFIIIVDGIFSVIFSKFKL